MSRPLSAGLLAAAFAAALAASGAAVAEPAGSAEPPGSAEPAGRPGCATTSALAAIPAALPRTAARIERGEKLTVVAIGSSSTLGVGASAPAMSYPSRLELDLKRRLPVEIRVVNHGIGGEDVAKELVRLDRDVIAEHPDLVIWQVGTNAVLRQDDVAVDEPLIRRGVDLIKENGIDLVLMDMQYAPRVLRRPAWAEMKRIIAEAAHRAHVGLFRRFEIMQEWDRTRQLAPDALIGSDGLHMTDASYGCLADQLAEALASNVSSSLKLAKSPHRSPAAVAGLGQPASAPPGGSGP